MNTISIYTVPVFCQCYMSVIYRVRLGSMIREDLKQLKDIGNRANSKIVSVGERQFLIGGITEEDVSSAIYEFRVFKQETDNTPVCEWKRLAYETDLLAGRNSFAACSDHRYIYIWGGLKTDVTKNTQQCLSELIEIDTEKPFMRLLPLKEPLRNHSAALVYHKQQNQLIAYGGTDEQSNLGAYLYRLNLTLPENETTYEWRKTAVKCEKHNGIVWQHTAHLTQTSLFTKQQGKFLTVIGGCKSPESPYNSIVEVDLLKNGVSSSLTLPTGLVSHDSVVTEETCFIFGGSVGGDFSSKVYALTQGKLEQYEGIPAIGCCCCLTKQGFLVYGGVGGPMKLNGASLLRLEQQK